LFGQYYGEMKLPAMFLYHHAYRTQNV
jgi:hypothetical protein